ncbi:MAG: hypothetical protein AAF389_19225 [Gemmatimonadota bacterium]
MKTIADHAERTLLRHANAAMRIDRLRAALAERIDHTLTSHRLRAVLEDDPDRFRIVDAWNARWPEVRATDDHPHAWVVALDRPERIETSGATRLKESVRWVGRSVDGRARLEAGRWWEIVAAEEPTRQALASPAA